MYTLCTGGHFEPAPSLLKKHRVRVIFRRYKVSRNGLGFVFEEEKFGENCLWPSFTFSNIWEWSHVELAVYRYFYLVDY